MDKIIEEKLKSLEKCEISNQGLIKDGYKLLAVYRKPSGSYTKYALIQCIYCNSITLKQYYNFINHTSIPCSNCFGKWETWARTMIGETVGHYKILEYLRCTKRSHNNKTDVYFKVQCIHCGKIREELYNKTNWCRYESCPDCSRLKLTEEERRFKEYKQGAKQRKINFDLNFQDFSKLIKQNCVYCGGEPQYRYRTIGIKSKVLLKMNGIDRIDSSKGYSMDNCVPCCTKCNQMKLDYSKKDFLEQVAKIYKYQIIQGSTTISQESTSEANADGNGGNPII